MSKSARCRRSEAASLPFRGKRFKTAIVGILDRQLCVCHTSIFALCGYPALRNPVYTKRGTMSIETAASVPSKEAASPSDEAWECLRGAYDLQVHVAPDVIARRIDDLDLAKEFLAMGLGGFVLKSHYFPTAERAQVVTKAVSGIRAFGAITLNHSVGGLNPVALELAGRSGCKIVWMPTVDAANETAGRPGGTNKKLPFWAEIQLELAATGLNPPPMTVIDDAGDLTALAMSCLELIRKHDMIL